VDVAKAIVHSEYKTTAARLDAVEEFTGVMEAQGVETETVIVSFGSPSNRAIREGFWQTPKSARTSDGRIVTVRPGSMSAEEAKHLSEAWGVRRNYTPDSAEVRRFQNDLASRVGWDYPEVVEPDGAVIISAKHSPGTHGGYWAIEVLVPIDQ